MKGQIRSFLFLFKHIMFTYSSLVHVNLFICEIFHLLEGIDRYQHRTNVSLFTVLQCQGRLKIHSILQLTMLPVW